MKNGLPLAGQAVFAGAPGTPGTRGLLSGKPATSRFPLKTAAYFVTTKRTASVVSSVATVAM